MLKADNLTKTFGRHHAVDHVSLNIASGEVFCLLGQNGAGKSTLIQLFLGLIKPTSGLAMINNTPCSTDTMPHCAYIPETVKLYDELTGIENLDYFSKLAGIKMTKDQLVSTLEKTGLSNDFWKYRLGSYSKGMRQKVAIAIALAKQASVIFMDEPNSGLDPRAMDELVKIVHDLRLSGKTVFIVTHDLANTLDIATRIGIMNQGKLDKQFTSGQLSTNELKQIYLRHSS